MATKEPSHRNLVIISLPFYRIARVSLSEFVLGSLREVSDVIIVAPFAEEPGFKASFGGPNTTFLSWALNRLNRVQRLLLSISEILRMNGYWKRFRNRGMAYYYANQFVRFSDDGRDSAIGFPRHVSYWLLSLIGVYPKAWVLVDRLLGEGWLRFPRLVKATERYGNVTLIQSANWGLQDRALAGLSRTHKWRKVLLPYTTDQLHVNGYLLNSFDAVCAQGSFEFDRARDVHAVPEKNIRRLGSAWFRHLAKLQSALAAQTPQKSNVQKIILYAGVASTYFPRESEFEAIDAIVNFITRSQQSYVLIYRPVEFDEPRKEQIRRKYDGVSAVRLQWPTSSQIGLDQYSEIDQDSSLLEYVRCITGCELVIMSSITSLCLDVAFLDKPGVIANFADPSGVLQNRHIHLADLDWLPGLRVAYSISELIETMEHLLMNREEAARESSQLIAPWDYPDVDFEATLLHAVYGQPTHQRDDA